MAKAGDQVGKWKLLRLLGEGGNADVWEAVDETGSLVALKILRRLDPNQEPYKRFREEIRTLQRLQVRPGILRLIDAHLPEHPTRSDRAWLAMPIAQPIREALGEQPALEDVVRAIGRIAQVLADLAGEGLYHRDIKPENLYSYDSDWCIGDFGLVAHPDKEALTQVGRRLGPMYYHAPELLLPSPTQPGPLDVFSLAKALWTLATDMPFPFPGPLDHDHEITRLGTYISHERVRQLELLLSRSTDSLPDNRPTMAEVAAELGAWMEGSIPVPAALLDESIVTRVRQVVGGHERLIAEEQQRHDYSVGLVGRADQRLREEILPQLNRVAINNGQGGRPEDLWQRVPEFKRLLDHTEQHFSGGPTFYASCPVLVGKAQSNVRLFIAVEIAVFRSSVTHVLGIWGLAVDNRIREVLWSESAEAPTGSAMESRALEGVLASAISQLSSVVPRFAQLVDEIAAKG